MDKTDRQAIRMMFDGRAQVCDITTLMTLLKLVRKRRQQLCEVRSLVAFCFCPLEEKIVNKSCFLSIFKVQTIFTPISRPDKHAELLKVYFKPLVKMLKFSTLMLNLI